MVSGHVRLALPVNPKEISIKSEAQYLVGPLGLGENMHHLWMCGLQLFTKGPKKLTTLNGTQSRKALQLVWGAVQAALSLGASSSGCVNTRMLEWNLS